MPTFAYRARNHTGEQVRGTLVADTSAGAVRMLDEKRLLPVELNEVNTDGPSFFTGKAKKVSVSKVGVIYEQLADLLNAGVPMLRALSVLSKQSTTPALSRVLREVHEDVAGGDSLADSMEKHGNAFPKLHCAMVRAGERGGFLEDVLTRLSEFVVRQDEVRNKFIGALIYPAVLFSVMLIAVTVIMTFVVPKIEPMLVNADKPWPTLLVFWVADLLTSQFLVIAGVALVVVLAVYSFFQSAVGARTVAVLQLKTPGIGPIYTMISLCRFCRILGTLLANGIPIIQSLEIAKASAGNDILAEAIHNAAENVRHGEALTQPLEESKLFPPAIVDMIAVAEESNTLDKTLVEVANTQEARTARQIDMFMRLLEPLLLFVSAGMVLFIAVALLLPIMSMATSGLGR